MTSSPFLAVPPSEWVAANALAFALRDRYPVSPGHTLVIPRRLVPTWFEATPEEQQALMALVEEVKRDLDAATHEIYIRDSDYKFAILHELGHAMFDAANGFAGGTARNYGADGDACGPAYLDTEHWMNSKEFQSAAAWEGVASFYAAHVLNDHSTLTPIAILPVVRERLGS